MNWKSFRFFSRTGIIRVKTFLPYCPGRFPGELQGISVSEELISAEKDNCQGRGISSGNSPLRVIEDEKPK